MTWIIQLKIFKLLKNILIGELHEEEDDHSL